MHRTHPPSRSSSARISKAQCTDVIYSAVWFTSTGELHERIYAPHTVEEPVARRLAVAFDELALVI